MTWVVIGEEKGKIKLVSKSSVPALLPKGSYLTVEDKDAKFVLRVDKSVQDESYSPSPMIVDMDLETLKADQKCQNIIYAYRVKDLVTRQDGLIDYIKPQSIARRSNQEEINLALNSKDKGPSVFVATVQASQNQLLKDESGKYISVKLPEDMFYHQMLICGKTGRGKTVATKYLAQYFIEEMQGAVLAINVKDVDFLKMDKASTSKNKKVLSEWEDLGKKAKGIENFTVYVPANTTISSSKGVTPEVCQKITLDVKDLDPESLTGLLQGITDSGARSLPDIFRFWKEQETEEQGKENLKFLNFINYFARARDDGRRFETLNVKGEKSEGITLHPGTYDSIQRKLNSASVFFDNKDAECLDESDILISGKMSVIDVANRDGIQFGSILLRNILHKIVEAKENQKYNVPILIIIDEVHRFYDTSETYEALGELSTICRTGRSQEIGVIFSSQNPTDIPKGLSSVINTKIFFNTDVAGAKAQGMTITREELESLKKGFAHSSVYEMPQLKIMKFPLAYSGVFDKNDK